MRPVAFVLLATFLFVVDKGQSQGNDTLNEGATEAPNVDGPSGNETCKTEEQRIREDAKSFLDPICKKLDRESKVARIDEHDVQDCTYYCRKKRVRPLRFDETSPDMTPCLRRHDIERPAVCFDGVCKVEAYLGVCQLLFKKPTEKLYNSDHWRRDDCKFECVFEGNDGAKRKSVVTRRDGSKCWPSNDCVDTYKGTCCDGECINDASGAARLKMCLKGEDDAGLKQKEFRKGVASLASQCTLLSRMFL